MSDKASKIEKELGDAKNNTQIEKDLELLRNELNKEYGRHKIYPNIADAESISW